ncbi:hypothetical protein COY90_03300 [Candidatus Roizmanbacteria bacterium CG_4_10_14_0_8_um_filter_39_9]|uniref:ArnT-like N-terminal domain-containing protein n=1 Tax=Candidatus Roizmanbacteria bacterium CG_4_10_14_0_8_um_filter_39_9 TaxID=1974829 RepID=A0A2M7QDJ2_9BACT|nr:MAG: hypothetical protein COY90_03300 [Candidatus Roizmanbacteria bacterium CG_4_10_14_0_8_um_filter_39_9]
MEKRKFSKLDIFLLTCICVVAIGMRLYKINAPLSDYHSWRQADTAAVARNYAKNGIDLLHPQYDDLSSIQSGQENPQGFRYVEFPIYNAIIAAEYIVAPFLPIEVYGRLTTIFFSLIIISIIYYLLLKEHSRLSAFIASLTYAIFPAFVFFSRVILPETPAIAFAFLAIFFSYRWSDGQSKNRLILLLASAFSMSISILIKPPVVFYLIPIVFLFFQTHKLDIWKKWEMYVYTLIVVAPFIAWRLFILKFPEGIPASDWLITSVNTYEGQKVIFMKPAFFRWIFYERINIMICGAYLTFFLLTGLVTKLKSYFLHSIFLAAMVYLFVFQGGNVQHEYYQRSYLRLLLCLSVWERRLS